MPEVAGANARGNAGLGRGVAGDARAHSVTADEMRTMMLSRIIRRRTVYDRNAADASRFLVLELGDSDPMRFLDGTGTAALDLAGRHIID